MEEGTSTGFQATTHIILRSRLAKSSMSEYLVIESEDDVDIWLKDNLNNIPADALPLIVRRKQQNYFNRAMSILNIYTRFDVFGEDYPLLQ